MGIEKISNHDERVIGLTEENVKQKIVVPILELLGHNKENMEFERRTHRGGKIDIFLGKLLPNDCKVIIDTKNYNEDLNGHVDQIKDYAYDEHAILAVLVNGTELRIYGQLRGVAFERLLLHSILRKDLREESTWKTLSDFLGFKNLCNRNVLSTIEEREREIKLAMTMEDELRMECDSKFEEVAVKIDGLEDEIEQLKKQRDDIEKEKQTKIRAVWEKLGLPPRASEQSSRASDSDDELDSEKTGLSQKARKVTFQALVEAGYLKDGQILYLCNGSKVFKDEQASVVAHSNKLKYKDGRPYSKSDLASQLLLKRREIGHKSVQGPKYWQTADAKCLLDLEKEYRRNKQI